MQFPIELSVKSLYLILKGLLGEITSRYDQPTTFYSQIAINYRTKHKAFLVSLYLIKKLFNPLLIQVYKHNNSLHRSK